MASEGWENSGAVALLVASSREQAGAIGMNNDSYFHPSIIAALVAGLVAVCSWFVAHHLAIRREDRTRRLQLTLEHAERQISQFYAPLLALLDQLDTTARVKDEMVKQDPDHKDMITQISYDEFFLQIHKEIQAVLKSKVHLLEGYEIPDSFSSYFDHFTSENIYWKMVREKKVSTYVKVPDFPSGFHHDVRKDFEKVSKRYENTLKELRRGIFTKRSSS